MQKGLYFIESVFSGEGLETQIVFQYIPNDISRYKSRDFRQFYLKTFTKYDRELIAEGKYVYYCENQYIDASNDNRVKQITETYQELKGDLLKQIYETKEPLIGYDAIDELYSFHINVGHGNHSLVLFKTNNKWHLWMIDCSIYDRISRKYYYSNITYCLDYIKREFKINDIKIEILMLTHPHYDHYSGITDYITHNFIDSSTLTYINLRYSITSHNYNNLLLSLKKLNVKIIEPFVENSNKYIEILYPELRNFKHNLSVNNISSVFNLQFNDKVSFIFPGDLETPGWDLLGASGLCACHMKNPRYYAISHHGSINGHIRKNCNCGNSPRNIKDCFAFEPICILMGRDGAYNRIYDKTVLTDFGSNILFSEKDDKGNKASWLKINLISGNHSWH